jgi:RNA polymerase sigma factor (sigma-70 family)
LIGAEMEGYNRDADRFGISAWDPGGRVESIRGIASAIDRPTSGPEATMSAEDPGSITRWLDGLKAGQPEAADAIWRRYYRRVVAVARRRLHGAAQRAVEDDEDVALSALNGLCAGAAQGRFEGLTDRAELWRLLAAITVKKALRHRQWHGRLKRGGPHPGPVSNPADDAGRLDRRDDQALAKVPGREPTPEAAAIMREQLQELLDSLPDPNLRQIAVWRLDGLSNAEIAAKLGCAVRTVERKLEGIRAAWSELAEDSGD